MESLLPSGILYGAVSRLSAIAEIEHGEKSRPAVRADDNADSVRTRLEAYDKSTAPLIDYYRGTGILSSVNGDQAPEDVFASIKEAAQL